MQIGIPSGLPVKWFTFNQVSEKTWIILKAKLTGKKQPGGGSYYSEVKLSDKEADTIIRNIKKILVDSHFLRKIRQKILQKNIKNIKSGWLNNISKMNQIFLA